MRRPKKKIVKVTETLHNAIGKRGIRDIVILDRLHLECGHYVDEAKARSHGPTRRCAICQTKKVPA